MKTNYWKINNHTSANEQILKEAAALLSKGSIVAFPTETVYGLGADATSEEAVSKIFQAKGRPQDNPLIAHVASQQQLKQLVSELPPFAKQLMDVFSPGALTYILPSNGTCAANVTAGLSTIAVRIPDHPVAQHLLGNCNIPIAAPSANLSGKPSPTTADHVWADLNGKIAGIIDGGPTGVGVESTVIDCTQEIPIILRPGGVTKEQIKDVAGSVMMDPALAGAKGKGQPKSPGMKYKHYAPEVPLWLVEGGPEAIQAIVRQEQQHSKQIGVLAGSQTAKLITADQVIALGENAEEVAIHLYDGLRTFKDGDVDLILCEVFSEVGIGQAIMNRLKKAATTYIGK